MAVNGGSMDISHLEEGLIQISGMLEQVSKLGKAQNKEDCTIFDFLKERPGTQGIRMLLRQVIKGDFSRIFKRLRLGEKIAASHVE
jgi:hypothetical protein